MPAGRATAWAGGAMLLAGLGFTLVRGSVEFLPSLVLAAGFLLLALSLLFTRWSASHPSIRAAGAAGFYWRSLALAVIALAAAVLVNTFSAALYLRTDHSQGGLYSLSPQTLGVLEELRTPVRLLAFIRDPQAVESLRQMMERYQSRSDQIVYSVVDPQRQLALARQHAVETPTQAVVESPLGRRKFDILTPLQQWRPDNERRISEAILSVGRAEPRKVYFLAGHGERDLKDPRDEGFRSAAEALRSQGYQVESLTLAQTGQVPEDADVLIAAGPQIDFQASQGASLHDYLRRGGRLMLLVDPLTDFQMKNFLASYGLALGHDLLLDEAAASPQLGPIAPLAMLDRQHPATRSLEDGFVVFPRVQSVWRRASSLGYATHGLASTSPQSWSESPTEGRSFDFDPQADRRGVRLVAAAAVKDADPASAALSPQARIMLAGDSDFAANAYFGLQGGGGFFLKTVQWMAGDAEVLDIPALQPVDRLLSLTSSQRRLLRWTLLAVLPALPLLAGLWAWRRRAAQSASS